jgi:hypothetical protein
MTENARLLVESPHPGIMRIANRDARVRVADLE